jgi:hypothetical protein
VEHAISGCVLEAGDSLIKMIQKSENKLKKRWGKYWKVPRAKQQ